MSLHGANDFVKTVGVVLDGSTSKGAHVPDSDPNSPYFNCFLINYSKPQLNCLVASFN